MQKRTPTAPPVALTPTLTYLLMVGELDRPGATRPHRLPGWSDWLTRPEAHAAMLREAWAQHGEALTADARAHDFEPHRLTGTKPHGASFEKWREAFLAAHRY